MPYSVTNASVHDSQKCTDLLEESDKAVFADSAYSSEEIAEKLPKNCENQICEKGYRNHPLTEEQKENKKKKSKIRCRIEHIFGFMTNSINGITIRSIGIDRLTKQYENIIAVDRISLQLTNGVYGLLGANGAGKTTFMRMLCGILKPTGGTVTFDGVDVSSEEYRSVLGYLPQDFGYYPDFSGWDFLMYMASLKGLTKSEAKMKTKELLEIVSLSDVGKKKIATYSGGMKQRLGIAQALLNDPKIIILDEPTAGLDPKERVRFRNLIKDLGKDSIVLLSTHIVSDVEHIADTVLIMKAGQIIYNGSAEEIENLEEFYLAKFEEA